MTSVAPFAQAFPCMFICDMCSTYTSCAVRKVAHSSPVPPIPGDPTQPWSRESTGDPRNGMALHRKHLETRGWPAPGSSAFNLSSFHCQGWSILSGLPWVFPASSAVKMADRDPAGIGNFSLWVALRLPCSLGEGNEELIKYLKHPCLQIV